MNKKYYLYLLSLLAVFFLIILAVVFKDVINTNIQKLLGLSLYSINNTKLLNNETVYNNSSIVMFEDNFIYRDTSVAGNIPKMVYRVEGPESNVSRTNVDGYNALVIGGKDSANFKDGWVNYIHPAYYDKAVLRVDFNIQKYSQGDIIFRIAHNGFFKNNEDQSDREPGLQLRLKQINENTYQPLLQVAGSNHILGSFPNITIATGSGRDYRVTISWDLKVQGDPVINIDLIQISNISSGALVKQNVSVSRNYFDQQGGGFSIAAEGSIPHFHIKKIQVLWPDTRPIYFYNGYDFFYDEDGTLVGTIPAPEIIRIRDKGTKKDGAHRVMRFPEKGFNYYTLAVDMGASAGKERTLIRTQPELKELSSPSLIGIRDLKTGKTTDITDTIPRGCFPGFGGGSMQGKWLFVGHEKAPDHDDYGAANLCVFDWDTEEFTLFAKKFNDDTGSLENYYDPAVALDGSMIRFGLRKTTNDKDCFGPCMHQYFLPTPDNFKQTYNRFEEMNKSTFSAFSNANFNYVRSPYYDGIGGLNRAHTSRTGGDALPTGLVIRDKDPLYYEDWISNVHTRNLGILPFTKNDGNIASLVWAEDDYYPKQQDLFISITDWVNLRPHLSKPGVAIADEMMWTLEKNVPGKDDKEPLITFIGKFLDNEEKVIEGFNYFVTRERTQATKCLDVEWGTLNKKGCGLKNDVAGKDFIRTVQMPMSKSSFNK